MEVHLKFNNLKCERDCKQEVESVEVHKEPCKLYKYFPHAMIIGNFILTHKTEKNISN